jgi:hypothetical protein
MSIGKLIKRIKKKVLKVVDPLGSKLGVHDAILGKDGKGGKPLDPGLDVFGNKKQKDEYYQKAMGEEQGKYRSAPDDAYAQAKADAQKAGTWADTREADASAHGEGSARARGMQSASMARINLLRQQLGLPSAEGDTAPSDTPPSLTPSAGQSAQMANWTSRLENSATSAGARRKLQIRLDALRSRLKMPSTTIQPKAVVPPAAIA